MIDSDPFEITWVLTHADLRRTARVKALMDYLVERLCDLFEGRKALDDPRMLLGTALQPLNLETIGETENRPRLSQSSRLDPAVKPRDDNYC